MSIRKTKLVSGEYYHVYNRGNSKQKIFHDKSDYNYFLKLLFICNQKDRKQIRNSLDVSIIDSNNKIVSIGSYVLMPNHFHLLITIPENGDLSKYMQKVSTGYVMYYNKKYKRTGSLFEGKFKSQYIGNDRYLKYLFSYINLNPVKLIQKDWKEKGIRDKQKALIFLDSYIYSSYLYFSSDSSSKIKGNILDADKFPKYFENSKSFAKEIFEWLSYKDFT